MTTKTIIQSTAITNSGKKKKEIDKTIREMLNTYSSCFVLPWE